MRMLVWLIVGCSEYDIYTKGDPPPGGETNTNLETEEELVEVCDTIEYPAIDVAIDDGCEIPAQIGSFDPVLEWHWQSNTINPSYHQVMAQPIAINLNDDNLDGIVDENDVVDIVFSTFLSSGYRYEGALNAISGEDGSMLWSTVNSNGVRPYGSSGLAAAMIDGVSPYIYAITSDGLGCFSAEGSLIWSTPLSHFPNYGIGQPAIADLEGDGSPEVMIGPHVLSAIDGSMLWTGSNTTGHRNMSYAADVDGDGFQEVIAGNTIYNSDGSVLIEFDASIQGFTAIADLDLDGIPEYVVNDLNSGSLRAFQLDGTELWQAFAPDSGGGPPTIADYDADGYPEIGVSGELFYRVIEHDGTLKWQNSIIDASSKKTGSSVFDFEGDGSAEVVYADEETLWVFDGATGTIEMEWTTHSSGTLYEYPIIVDVDGDGSAEIVAAANDYSSHNDSHGIVVIGDVNSSWNPGRPIWNQHAYSITNIFADGAVPLEPELNWLTYNNFRSGDLQARTGNKLADLYTEIVYVCYDECEEERLYTIVTVGNKGTLDVQEPIILELYGLRVDASVELLDIVLIEDVILAGAQLDGIEFLLSVPSAEGFVSLFAEIDTVDTVLECNENNNTYFWGDVLCP